MDSHRECIANPSRQATLTSRASHSRGSHECACGDARTCPASESPERRHREPPLSWGMLGRPECSGPAGSRARRRRLARNALAAHAELSSSGFETPANAGRGAPPVLSPTPVLQPMLLLSPTPVLQPMLLLLGQGPILQPVLQGRVLILQPGPILQPVLLGRVLMLQPILLGHVLGGYMLCGLRRGQASKLSPKLNCPGAPGSEHPTRLKGQSDEAGRNLPEPG